MLNFTSHAKSRMNQRGISKEMIELVLEYGEYIKDKIILNSRNLKKLVKRVSRKIKSKLLKLLDKGGVIVVLSDDAYVITVYNHCR